MSIAPQIQAASAFDPPIRLAPPVTVLLPSPAEFSCPRPSSRGPPVKLLHGPASAIIYPIWRLLLGRPRSCLGESRVGSINLHGTCLSSFSAQSLCLFLFWSPGSPRRPAGWAPLRPLTSSTSAWLC